MTMSSVTSAAGMTGATRPGAVPFAPSEITGCRLWLRADQIVGSDGDAITSWADQSGLGFNGTGAGTVLPKFKTGLTAVGGPAVLFDAAGKARFSFGNVMASAAAGEVFMVVKATGADCGLWAFGASGGVDQNHYPYAGIVYDSFGLAAGQRKSFTPFVSISSAFRKYNIRANGSSWQAWLDGLAQVFTATGVTVGWNAAPVLGAGVSSGAVDFGFGGWIAEVIVYNSVLSLADRALVMAHLDRHFVAGYSADRSGTMTGGTR